MPPICTNYIFYFCFWAKPLLLFAKPERDFSQQPFQEKAFKGGATGHVLVVIRGTGFNRKEKVGG